MPPEIPTPTPADAHPDEPALREALAESSARLASLEAENAAKDAMLGGIDAALAKEFGPMDKRSGDLIDDMEAFVEHHKAKEAELVRLRAGLSSAAEHHRTALQSFSSDADSRISQMQADNERLRTTLIKCFRHLGADIQRKHLNESAKDGTQALSSEIAKLLDSPPPALSSEGQRTLDKLKAASADILDTMKNLPKP